MYVVLFKDSAMLCLLPTTKYCPTKDSHDKKKTEISESNTAALIKRIKHTNF